MHLKFMFKVPHDVTYESAFIDVNGRFTSVIQNDKEYRFLTYNNKNGPIGFYFKHCHFHSLKNSPGVGI